MISSSPWLYIVALLFIGILASTPGLLAFRRQIHTESLPSISMEKELAALKKELADIKQDRLELSAQVVESQKEVERLRAQLRQLSGLRALFDQVLVENIDLRRQVEALRNGMPMPPTTIAGDQLGPLLERERVVTAALNTIETQIIAAGGEYTAPVALITQRDGLKRTLAEIESDINRLHSEGK